MANPKKGEFWWAWPPDGGDAQPVEILKVNSTGNHALIVLGRSEVGYSRQWSLAHRIEGRPSPSPDRRRKDYGIYSRLFHW